jgi:double-stranded uracil-DNA glycosylase
MAASYRPSKADLLAAADKKVPDIIGPGLSVLFCGINPGLYSAAIGHHFGRPGNRFWPALYLSGFTDRQLSPYEDGALLRYGCGITNVVDRASAAAAELSAAEFAEGGQRLVAKVGQVRPQVLAVLGVGAYRSAFGQPAAVMGRQQARVGGVLTWVLPNPSGLNAHYGLDELAQLFRELRLALDEQDSTTVDR